MKERYGEMEIILVVCGVIILAFALMLLWAIIKSTKKDKNEYGEVREDTKKSNKSFVKIIVVCILLAGFAFGTYGLVRDDGGSSSTSSSSTSSSTKTCQSCHRSFADMTNKNYIWHTNMCKNCYQNFCWATGMTPTNYDK